MSPMPPTNADLFDAVTALLRGEDDLPFWQFLATQAGGPILECGAGTCRVLAPLLKAGVDAYGLELSEERLCAGRLRLKALGGDASQRLLPGDMTDFSHPRRYRLVLIPLNTVALLSDEALDATLKCIRKHLHPEGELAFDLDLQLVPPDGANEGWVTEWQPIDVNGRPAQLRQRFQSKPGGGWDVEQAFRLSDGSDASINLSLVVRSLSRMTELLAGAGWRIRLARDEGGKEVTESSRIAFVLANPLELPG